MWPTVFEVSSSEEKIKRIEAGFAQGEYGVEVQQEYAALKEEVGEVRDLQKLVLDQQELAGLAFEESDDSLVAGVAEALKELEGRVEQLERAVRFNGPYDKGGVIMTIQSGAGGTDAQDWAAMLERMYLRFAEGQGWKTTQISRSAGEEAGIKHSTFEIRGRYAYGTLREEHGIHRLVRLSPFNADNLRQTSFARVEVVPKVEAQAALEIDPGDLKIDTFRAGGAGGQHVNKTDSAVRITHVPTGVVAQSQNERSQAQNKALAMAVLQGKLQMLADEQHVEKLKDLKGEVKEAAWGNQIRSYVLHPYKLVKDHRTDVETSAIESVLEGNLEPFLG